MPQCIKCPNKQSKLNVGDLCYACFNKEKHQDGEEVPHVEIDIAGIPMSEIDSIPDITVADLNQPITTGAMLKIIAGAMQPIHQKLADHERRISKLEDGQKETADTVKKVEAESKNAENRLTVTETKIKNLEQSQGKLKNIVAKQQSQIAYQNKKERLRNVVLAGLSETEPLGQDNLTTDRDKVRYILDQLDLHHVTIASSRRTGNKDQGPQERPRFLVVELTNQDMRHEFKAAGTKLNNIDHLKHIRVKADLSKGERDEYKRLYDLKDKLQQENPGATVLVDKGAVLINGTQIDKFKNPGMDF